MSEERRRIVAAWLAELISREQLEMECPEGPRRPVPREIDWSAWEHLQGLRERAQTLIAGDDPDLYCRIRRAARAAW